MKYIFYNTKNLYRNISILLSIFVIATTQINSVYTQQISHFTQYLDNGLFYNPAYAGSKQMLNFTAMHRQQWAGIEGNPTITTIQIHSPINYQRFGIGLSLFNESEGLINKNAINSDFSYSIFLNNNAQLSFGTKFGAYWTEFDRNKLFPFTKKASEVPQWEQTHQFNVGAGILYHSPSFFMGLSSPQLVENSYDKFKKNKDNRHYFMMLGYVADIHNKWKIRTSAQLKFTQSTPISIDASLTFIYNDKFWIACLYRYDKAAGTFIQFNLTQHLKIGVASEFNLKSLRNYGVGTFEVLLSYNLKLVKKGIYSPRYF